MLKFINEKIYKKEKNLNHLIYSFIEVYFRKNISSSNIKEKELIIIDDFSKDGSREFLKNLNSMFL